MDYDDLKNFGIYLKNLAHERGIESGTELARMAKISPSTISRIYAGKLKTTPDTLAALAPHLGVSYNHLMEKAGYISMVSEPGVNYYANNADNADNVLTKQIEQLNDRDRALVKALVDTLSKKEGN